MTQLLFMVYLVDIIVLFLVPLVNQAAHCIGTQPLYIVRICIITVLFADGYFSAYKYVDADICSI